MIKVVSSNEMTLSPHTILFHTKNENYSAPSLTRHKLNRVIHAVSYIYIVYLPQEIAMENHYASVVFHGI